MTSDAHASEGALLVLRDGRRLGYAQYGRPDGEPVLYFHGHPGSRLEASLAHEAAAASGFRVIALDRPGCGLSDFQPGRAITDWPADVAEAADALGISTFSVAGASGGGPYALACAWRLPGRVVQAAVISGVGPFQVPGIKKGMHWQNRIFFPLAARWPALAGALMRSMRLLRVARETRDHIQVTGAPPVARGETTEASGWASHSAGRDDAPRAIMSAWRCPTCAG